jgi:DNA polymerase-1
MGTDLSYIGQPTTIIYGFLKNLIDLQEQFRTGRFLFCFDSKASLRKNIYPAYKQKRHAKELTEEELEFEKAFRLQIKKLRRKYLPEIGYRNIFRKNGFESDDLLAYLARKVTNNDPGARAVIITADHDLFQCIAPRVSIYNPSSRKELTLQEFKHKYDIHPKKWATVKAIAGCNTDGVEGVRGVGELTAIKYLNDKLGYKTKAYAAITSNDGKRIRKRNMQLVKLPFKDTPKLNIVQDNLSIKGWKLVCKRLGFKSIDKTDPFPWSRE